VRSPLPSSSRLLPRGPVLARLATLALAALSACGGAAGPAGPSEPFVAQFPDEGPGRPQTPPPPTPPPSFPAPPVWSPDAFGLERTALFGSFPADVDRLGDVLFTTDADAVESEGARIVAVDVSGPVPVPSPRHETVRVFASDLVDSLGAPGDASVPIAFGFFVNDLRVVSDSLGFALVNAGGSDSAPTCSNLVVFDPSTGDLRQVVDLANPFPAAGLVDSQGAAVPGQTFTQAGAEGLDVVPVGGGRSVLYVAMSNFVIGAPSFGAVKYPGTVQVFDVDPALAAPVSPRGGGGPLVTQTLRTRDYNPSAVTRFTPLRGPERVLVTAAGTTAFDASFRLFPATPASVEAYDAATQTLLGTFDLGLAGLSSSRPAVGRDGARHAVAFLASSVLGEVYLLRLDGLDGEWVDPSRVAVLRGPGNGIPIDAVAAGGPGGNVSGLALSSDGRTLLASGFGDLFAFPAPKPGRLLALSLPFDVVSQPLFAREFLPGTASLATAPGRTLGPIVLAPGSGGAEVWVTVSGAVDPATFLGTGPASLGSLDTHGAIR
jgi:hypothetical protein